jgi:hypothetical protein
MKCFQGYWVGSTSKRLRSLVKIDNLFKLSLFLLPLRSELVRIAAKISFNTQLCRRRYSMAKERKDNNAVEVAAFAAGGAAAGAGVAASVGGMGLAIGGTAVAITATPVVAAGAVVGLAIYGLKRAFFP